MMRTLLDVPSTLVTSAIRRVSEGDLAAARAQMGFSLAWHIIVACLGSACPP
ncbi:hypothetical protein N7U49_02535 [Streptomyces sp. AD2-2]|nr:hypothetical protein N7U49_02535 [Streptomyces sp. AD2-2]